MNKRGSWVFWISLTLVILLFIAAFFYFALFRPKDNINQVINIQNPLENLTNEQAAVQFNESFVYYLLYSIQAYNLHNPPLSSNNPKISLLVGEDSYYSIINNGDIFVSKGEDNNSDIKIITTKSEAVMMLRDKKYISSSFQSGNSKIELLAGKTVLFSKGYLNLYTQVTGKSVTGNVVRIFTS